MKKHLAALLFAAVAGIAQTEAQTLWSWGYNINGELGQGTWGSGFGVSIPKQAGSDNNWKSVTSAGSTTLALKTDSTLWGWGKGSDGQLGGTSNTAPVQIGTDKWAIVSEGTYHAVALKADGSLWTWGDNATGALGNGTSGGNAVKTPTQIGTDKDWTSVAAGQWYTLALKTDGSIWYWGHSNVGSVFAQTTPVQIGTDKDWAFIATGWNSHNIAIKKDGTLWAWGLNDRGQIGQGFAKPIPIDTPTKVGTDNNWKSASVGHSYTLAMKTDGTLWAWGWNDRGQAGNGGTTDIYAPTQVGNSTDWKFATVGRKHSAAIKTDGSLWIWGWNGDSQLGDGTTADKSTPTRVGTANDWEYVAADEKYTVALRKAANTSVKNVAGNTASVTVYPNPANAQVFFNGDVQTVILFDVAGKVLTTTNNNVVDISSLPVGILLYKATTTNGAIATGTITKY